MFLPQYGGEGHKETCGDDEYVYYLDCCSGFMGLCVCAKSSNHIY